MSPTWSVATHTMFTCSDTSLSNIKKMIHQHRLNRIVVASCTPRTHEPLFRETLREAGLNPYLFELANIRDQCSWVHSAAPEAATEKAIELVKMSIARAQAPGPLTGNPGDRPDRHRHRRRIERHDRRAGAGQPGIQRRPDRKIGRPGRQMLNDPFRTGGRRSLLLYGKSYCTGRRITGTSPFISTAK